MKLHKLEGYIQSIYLVEYEHGLLLLDGCSRADIGMLKHFIVGQLHRPFTDLKLVVVTHMHPDHAGAAVKLRQLSGCRVAAANVPGQWYSGVDGKLMHLTDILLAKWVAKRMKKPRRNLWYTCTLTPDIKLNDGDSLPGFSEWQALFTQGHTDRDLSLYHRPSHTVYVADLMVKVKGRYIPPFPVFYPNRYRHSLKKIMAMAPSSLILAHGGEVYPSPEEYQYLLSRAPNVPMTHWRSVKSKLRQVLRRAA
ncbi:MBL fold metallo-hydrolase [Photobacterium sp. TY1-4]|uniref:MBL fold metallo-hydrolase n=1 Tax=Photobacterium sp. TY1-4 TaxID=2899122 RepID=UPI0021C1DF75|nr:MBL fold metallo-hydrolase [Photobacterium sp. TY1-4]UXH99953.1 MBL fold metallo-hydrolase [Photobacterium sp. TY1-4]